MKTAKNIVGLLAGSAAVIAFYACSANSGDPDAGQFQQTNGGGFGNGTGRDASLGNGGGTIFPGGGSANTGPIFGTSGAGGGRNNGAGDACPAIRQKPETIIVYKDATVTDTIYESKPVALFIMQDRSSSMIGLTGDPNSWPNSTAAITAFVNDGRTAGIDIALGVFPPMNFTDLVNQADCATASDCGQMVVPWGRLPQNGPAMVQGYNTATPTTFPILFTPTECALKAMINNCLVFMQNAVPPEQCVAILVTDGAPTTCDVTTQNLVNIVADGHAKGVTTYTLGLPGAVIAFLDQLANAGGTNKAIDITQGGAQAFIDALNNIRQTIAVTTSTVVTTSTTIATPLPCEWNIPDPPPGTTFEKDKVNVQFTPPGAAAVDFGRVDNLGQCAQTTADAWYYDDPANPTKVLACPNSCNGTLKNSAGAEVAVLFGCDTHIIFH